MNDDDVAQQPAEEQLTSAADENKGDLQWWKERQVSSAWIEELLAWITPHPSSRAERLECSSPRVPMLAILQVWTAFDLPRGLHGYATGRSPCLSRARARLRRRAKCSHRWQRTLRLREVQKQCWGWVVLRAPLASACHPRGQHVPLQRVGAVLPHCWMQGYGYLFDGTCRGRASSQDCAARTSTHPHARRLLQREVVDWTLRCWPAP